MNHYKRYSGFTLIELLIVMVVLAILVSIAVPSMEHTIKSNSVRALYRSHLSALNYARSEAVTRNKLVSMCAANASSTACGEDWSEGWLVFLDNGADGNFDNGELDSNEELLRVFENKGNSRSMVVDSGGRALTLLTWNYRGFLHKPRDSSVLFVVCDRDGEAGFARGLYVEQSGRVMQTRDSDDDGIHESPIAPHPDLSCEND